MNYIQGNLRIERSHILSATHFFSEHIHKHFIYLPISAHYCHSSCFLWGEDEETAIFTLLQDCFVIYTQNYLPNLLLQFEIGIVLHGY